MKKPRSLCMVVLLCLCTTANAQTLFTYGRHAVDKKTFLHAFERNNTTRKSDSMAVKEYLNLFIRYSLKVQAAYDLGFDTLPQLRLELADYRTQVAKNYLTDEKVMETLVKEAYENGRMDIRISHIYIPYNGKDSLAARTKAEKALSQLKSGQNFGQVAAAFSGDPSVKENLGDIGWINTFLLPYPLERLAYRTPLNENSPVYKSAKAYHIFRRTAERPAAGRVQVAQILLAGPSQQKEKLSKLADSVYQALRNGADFGQLARQYSADDGTYNNEGLMQPFGVGTYDPVFEDQAFALPHDNAISKPFTTTQGIHILKRITAYPAQVDNPEEQFASIRNRVLEDERSQLASAPVLKQASAAIGFKRTAVSDRLLGQFTSSYYKGTVPPIAPYNLQSPIATTRTGTYRFQDFAAYLAANRETGSNDPATQYFRQVIMDEYLHSLEKYNKAYAAQLTEFREGNMLFEAMQRFVWEKAANDEDGLRKYFSDHRENYKWKESISAVIFTAGDSVTLARFRQQLALAPGDWKKVLLDNGGSTQAETGRFEAGQLPATDATTHVMVLERHPAGELRQFDDAKGMVLNDYQQKLEEEWILSLQKKYPVKVDSTVLRSIYR